MQLTKAKSELENIVLKYKQHENLSPSKPPPIGGYWSPEYGFLSLVENKACYEYGFCRNILLGVSIGSKFANYDRKVISDLKSDIKSVLQHLDGHILDIYGTAYSVLGISKD